MAYWIVISVLILIVFPAVLLFFISTTSEEDGFFERIGQAINNLLRVTTGYITRFISTITEPRKKKARRLAEEQLAYKNRLIYLTRNGSRFKQEFERSLNVDESFKHTLDVLGLSEDDWENLAMQLFYISQIKYLSRSHNDYSLSNSKADREAILKWSEDKLLHNHYEVLIDALNYFDIPLQEWIEIGDAALSAHGVFDSRLIREYGFMTALKPSKNNSHLL